MTNRLIPTTWFRAQAQATTMSFIIPSDSNGRDAPIQEGERKLGWFVLPPFQRPAVWTEAQQVRLIESLWMGLPVGVFIYNEAEYGSPYDNWLLDGQQRVTACLSYMADGFKVYGYLYSELTEVDHRKWEMSSSLPSMKVQSNNVDELREIYDRLAYGGTPHEPKA